MFYSRAGARQHAAYQLVADLGEEDVPGVEQLPPAINFALLGEDVAQHSEHRTLRALVADGAVRRERLLVKRACRTEPARAALQVAERAEREGLVPPMADLAGHRQRGLEVNPRRLAAALTAVHLPQVGEDDAFLASVAHFPMTMRRSRCVKPMRVYLEVSGGGLTMPAASS